MTNSHKFQIDEEVWSLVGLRSIKFKIDGRETTQTEDRNGIHAPKVKYINWDVGSFDENELFKTKNDLLKAISG